MLGLYKHYYSDRMGLLPLLPSNFDYSCVFAERNCELPHYVEVEEGGSGGGVWDPDSWGQWIGGTHAYPGMEGFVDSSHIIGYAIKSNPTCHAAYLCSNTTMSSAMVKHYNTLSNAATSMHSSHHSTTNHSRVIATTKMCLAGVFVTCNHTARSTPYTTHDTTQGSVWTPLLNLHVHSKQPRRFCAKPCNCGESLKTSSSGNSNGKASAFMGCL